VIWRYVIGFFAGLMCGLFSSQAETPSPGVSYCAIWAREAARIDIMHTAPVSAAVTDAYIEGLAVKLFSECVSVVPALLPLPEGHRDLGTWVKDMQRMLILQPGTEPAAEKPPAQGDADDEWRAACAAEYQTWDEETGTVVRAGSPERVRCPCGKEVDCG
jgi:hypothetical protein